MRGSVNAKNTRIFQGFLWILEGIIVGFGAIMPGLSGGTLCVSFGMYHPFIAVLSKPRTNLRKYGKMLFLFLVGVMGGFVGLSGLAAWLMEKNSSAVACAFIGFILGTFPELWHDAGEQGRTKCSFFSVLVGFVIMLVLLRMFQVQQAVEVRANVLGYLFCGVLWGLSFIVPGLSSSTLLIFFGLYQPMLDGISRIDIAVLLPLAVGMAACVLLLSRVMNIAFQKWYSLISHAIIGMVAATTLMIFPAWSQLSGNWMIYLVYILGGAILSYLLTRLCDKLKSRK